MEKERQKIMNMYVFDIREMPLRIESKYISLMKVSDSILVYMYFCYCNCIWRISGSIELHNASNQATNPPPNEQTYERTNHRRCLIGFGVVETRHVFKFILFFCYPSLSVLLLFSIYLFSLCHDFEDIFTN